MTGQSTIFTWNDTLWQNPLHVVASKWLRQQKKANLLSPEGCENTLIVIKSDELVVGTCWLLFVYKQ